MARKKKEEARRIGARLIVYRETAGYTQEAVARRLKVGDRTYQSWEYGEAVPRWHNREKLAKLYKVTVEDIMGAPPPRAPSDQLARIESQLAAIETRLNGQDDVLAALVKTVEAQAGVRIAAAARRAQRQAPGKPRKADRPDPE